MNDAWNENAPQRHEQILSGNDITFSELLAPKIIKLITSISDVGSSRLIEIGCGTGILAGMLAPKISELVGIDTAPQCIELAKEHNKDLTNIKFLVQSANELTANFTDEFDIAVAHMVLHVIEDIDTCLANISQILKETGTFIFTIPHPCFWAEVKTDFRNVDYEYIKPASYKFPFVIANDKNPLTNDVPYVHRPLEVYFEQLNQNNLRVINLYEPYPDSNLSMKYSRKWKYPGFLLFFCQKAG